MVGNLLFLVSMWSCFTCVGETLPSLNYWNISLEIVRTPKLAASLGVSREQCDRIRAMRSSERYLKLFTDEQRKHEELEISEIWLILDADVERDLGAILTVDQMRSCRETLLRLRLQTVEAFFSDGEVLNYLRLSDRQRTDLAKSVAMRVAARNKSLVALGTEAAKRVFEEIPKGSLQQFANYIGDDKLLAISPAPGLKFGDVPFPAICSSGSVISYLPSADAVKLSDKQKLELAAIEKDKDVRLLAYSGNDVPGFMQGLQEETYVAMTKVLTQQQHILLSQHVARSEFYWDVYAPFKQQSFVRYLNLGDKQQEVLEFAKLTSESARKNAREMESTLFEDVVNALPNDARIRARKLLPNGF